MMADETNTDAVTEVVTSAPAPSAPEHRESRGPGGPGGGNRGGPGGPGGNRGRGDAELLLERFDPLGELEHRDAFQLLDPVSS